VWRSTGNGVDLSVPVNPHSGLPRAWYRGPATAEPVRSDGWVGSVAEGGSVNFRDVTFNPHAHGTHTETREHVRDEFHPIDALARSGALPFLMPSLLIDAHPESSGDDWVVPLSALARHAPWMQTHQPSAVILRCTNGDVQRDWSQTNPPYLDAGFAEDLVARGVQHLLLDLPSVDREVDGGELSAHHAFFGPISSPREGATISELLCVPAGLKAGPGLLAMQVAPFVHDAAPSRPLWFPATVESHK
ncbi:MAG: cyclase family protein, partial [Bacteroidota bacterium]|nr:cyclase family protein [Bacteroidota bacterium]